MFISLNYALKTEIKSKMAKYKANGETFETFVSEYGYAEWMDDYTESEEGEEMSEAECKAIDDYLASMWDSLISYGELEEAADRYTEANYPYHSDRFSLLDEIMQNGETMYTFGDVDVSIFRAGSEYEKFGDVIEYSVPLKDTEGDVENWRVLCYEIA